MQGKKTKDNSIEGWSDIIREDGRLAREREKVRKTEATELIASTKSMKDKQRLKTLLIAHRQHRINLNELFDELHSWVGITDETK